MITYNYYFRLKLTKINQKIFIYSLNYWLLTKYYNFRQF